MPTIELTITGDEQPTGISLRTLTRSDTGNSVAGVSLPAAFTSAGQGVWTFTFTAPDSGLHYDYTFRLTWADTTTDDESGSLDDNTSTAAAFGMRTGGENKVGQDNLYTYANREDGDAESTAVDNAVSAVIADLLVEANADMAIAWREFADVALGYSNTTEHRWLDDTAEYGLVSKAWAGRNVSEGQTDAVPQQVATAINEWATRLQMLRTGAVLKDYYDDEDDDVGILALQEGLAPVAHHCRSSCCCRAIDSAAICTCGCN